MKNYEVYCKNGHSPSLTLDDMSKVIFIKHGFRTGYFTPVYNVVHAAIRGFWLFGLCIAALNVLLLCIAQILPLIPNFTLETSLFLFVGCYGSDIELYFMSVKNYSKLTNIYAKNLNDAKSKFYNEFCYNLKVDVEKKGLAKKMQDGELGL